MKTRVVLIASVLLNAGLAAAFIVGRSRTENLVKPKEDATVASAKTASIRHSRTTEVIETASVVTNDFKWAMVESQDYKEYIARLRSIGCPEQTVRDIIIADVNALFGQKIAALRPKPGDFKFWKTNDREARNAERERERKHDELEREKRKLIKELLGVDFDIEMAKWEGRADPNERRYGFLPPEKQEQMRALREKYREMERTMFGDNNNNWTPENRAKLIAVRAQLEAEIAQVLTPAEFEQYQLRNSATAGNMRSELVTFQPTESEFREIFKLQKAYNDQYGMFGGGGDETFREQRRQAQQQLEEQLSAMLGADRYRDYTMAQDDRYREIYDFTERNDLSRDVAKKIYDVRLAAETERRRIEADKTISAADKRTLITAIGQETTQALGGMMSANAWKDYQRRAGWINRFTRVDNQQGPGGTGDLRPGERQTRN